MCPPSLHDRTAVNRFVCSPRRGAKAQPFMIQRACQLAVLVSHRYSCLKESFKGQVNPLGTAGRAFFACKA